MTGQARDPVERWAPWLLVWVGVLLVLVYWVLIEVPQTDLRIARHNDVLEGVATSPYRYRMLSVLVAEGGLSILSPLMGERRSFHFVYLTWNTAGALGLLVGQYKLLGRWFRSETALWGSLIVVPAMILSLADPAYYFQPFSIMEAAAVVWTLSWAIERRRWVVLAALTLATSNRETAVLAAIMVAAIWSRTDGPQDEPMGIAWAGSPFLVWGITYGAVRWLRGPAPPAITLPQILAANTAPAVVAWAVLLFGLFLGPLWLAAVRGLSVAPPVLRRAAWAVPPALGLYLVFGIWREVRILLVVLPVLAALAVFGVTGRDASVEPAA